MSVRDVCAIIDEVEMRMGKYNETSGVRDKVNIETCFYEIFEMYGFLERGPYESAQIEGRRSLAHSLKKWSQIHPEDSKVEEWIRLWEYKKGGLF